MARISGSEASPSWELKNLKAIEDQCSHGERQKYRRSERPLP